jgi:hypothetical protein
MHQMRLAYLVALAALGCGPAARPAATTVDNHASPGTAKEPSIRSIDWKNHTYDLGQDGTYTANQGSDDFTIDGDGNMHDADWHPPNPDDQVDHGSFEIFDPDFGDVDGDGNEDVAITTDLNTGGTGQFTLITVYTMRGGKPVAMGTIPGGDRGDGGIENVTIDHGRVLVDRMESGPDDGACCPSQIQHEQWTWNGSAFVEDEKARTTTANQEGNE